MWNIISFNKETQNLQNKTLSPSLNLDNRYYI